MGRYFFEVFDEEGSFSDELGVEIASREHIQAEVGRILTDIARDEIPLSKSMRLTIHVKDERKIVIYEGTLQYDSMWQEG